MSRSGATCFDCCPRIHPRVKRQPLKAVRLYALVAMTAGRALSLSRVCRSSVLEVSIV